FGVNKPKKKIKKNSNNDFPFWIILPLLAMSCKVVLVTFIELWEFYLLYDEHGFLRGWHIYFERGHEKITLSVTGLFKLASWSSNICSFVAFLILSQRKNIAVQEMNEKVRMVNTVKALFVLVLIMEWLHTLMFAQALKSTGRLVLAISRILVRDVSRFTFIFIMLLMAFSAALLIRSNDLNQHAASSKQSVLSQWIAQMFNLYQVSLGLQGFSEFGESTFDRTFVQCIYITFSLLSVVMLWNLLIAVMTETTESIREKATEQWLMQWASTVLLIERRVPRCWYKRTGIPAIKFGFHEQSGEYFITFTQVKDKDFQNRLSSAKRSQETKICKSANTPVIKFFRNSIAVSDN
ncbi:hypothetical protein RFI_25906, partial [Reticulomyxa filosa]